MATGPIFRAPDSNLQTAIELSPDLQQTLEELVAAYQQLKRQAAPRCPGLAFDIPASAYREIQTVCRRESAALSERYPAVGARRVVGPAHHRATASSDDETALLTSPDTDTES